MEQIAQIVKTDDRFIIAHYIADRLLPHITKITGILEKCYE